MPSPELKNMKSGGGEGLQKWYGYNPHRQGVQLSSVSSPELLTAQQLLLALPMLGKLSGTLGF